VTRGEALDDRDLRTGDRHDEIESRLVVHARGHRRLHVDKRVARDDLICDHSPLGGKREAARCRGILRRRRDQLFSCERQLVTDPLALRPIPATWRRDPDIDQEKAVIVCDRFEREPPDELLLAVAVLERDSAEARGWFLLERP